MPLRPPLLKTVFGVIVSIGTDLLEIDRIETLLQGPRGSAFLERVYTPDEVEYCESRHRPAESFAARFAAKEAISKCLRTGRAEGVSWREIEVLRNEQGAVDVRLSGHAARIADNLGIGRVLITLSHSRTHAIAFATAVEKSS